MIDWIKNKPIKKICAVVLLSVLLIDVYRTVRIYYKPRVDLDKTHHPTYMIYYGELDDDIIRMAKQYDIVILHPDSGNITREQVRRIQAGGAYVFGYLSVGEDLRTNGMTPEQMRKDSRFTGDGTGPKISSGSSPEGSGFASYYLDDNDHNGMPDFNPNFNCAYTNIGDPAWYDVLDNMTADGVDQIAGIKEILTKDYGRGLGCDGIFLDTIDTCAPNSYTKDEDPAKTRFEWTAPGVINFMKHLKEDYPDKYIVQNRGLFFYNYQLPHFEYSPRKYVDFLMFESYMLDSNPEGLYNEYFFADNKNSYAPKISAEADRPDGFRVLSLDYAEGPEEYNLRDTLTGGSDTGLAILLEAVDQAQNKAGFSHYITDGGLLLVNDFVIAHEEKADTAPPVWSSVHNYAVTEPIPRIGIGQVESAQGGVIVRWDVAMDKSGVVYTLYYQKEPFDFLKDPDLKKAEKTELVPEMGEGYGYGGIPDAYPYQAVVKGLESGETYYFVIRARDCSDNGNEKKNTVVVKGESAP